MSGLGWGWGEGRERERNAEAGDAGEGRSAVQGALQGGLGSAVQWMEVRFSARLIAESVRTPRGIVRRAEPRSAQPEEGYSQLSLRRTHVLQRCAQRYRYTAPTPRALLRQPPLPPHRAPAAPSPASAGFASASAPAPSSCSPSCCPTLAVSLPRGYCIRFGSSMVRRWVSGGQRAPCGWNVAGRKRKGGQGETYISLLMNSKRLSTLAFASAWSCFRRTGPTCL